MSSEEKPELPVPEAPEADGAIDTTDSAAESPTSAWKSTQATKIGDGGSPPPAVVSDVSGKRPKKKNSKIGRTKSAKNIPLAPPPPPEEQTLTYDSMKASVPWEAVYASKVREEDPFQDIVSFPHDDIRIVTFPKIHRTEMEAKPPGDDAELDPYVKICLQCFSADWKLVIHQYTRYDHHKFVQSVYDLPRVAYQVSDTSKPAEMPEIGKKVEKPKLGHRSRSVSQKQSIVTSDVGLDLDDPHFQYSKPVTKRTLALNKKARRTNQLGWFQFYDPEYDWQPGSEVALCHKIRKTQAPNTKTQAQHFRPFYFTIKANNIAFQLGNFEPFFGRLLLVDLKARSVLSETFHFHTNEDVILQKIGKNIVVPTTNVCEADTALFSVTRRHADIYLFLIVDKVLQGDAENSVDPYAKIKALVKQKDQIKCQNRIKAEVDDYCQRMGKFRQPFGWSALQVFDPKGNLNVTGDSLFESIYHYVGDKTDTFSLLTTLAEVNKGTLDAKKLGKNLNGFCSITVEKVEESDIPGFKLIDPSLQDVKSAGAMDYEGPTLREIYEFPQIASMTPNFYYVNNMYIYPESVNLGSLAKGKSNIGIKVQVKCDDLMGIDEPGLKCFYSPSMPTGLVDAVYTTVHYHSKSPTFNEEFKIALPAHLTANHHLLFTFFNVNLGKGRKGEEEIVAHTVVPLYPDNRIVVHNAGANHQVPLVAKLDQAYMGFWKQYCADTKPAFNVRFKLVSTIYPEDASITRFLNIYHTTEDEVDDDQLVETLQGLKNLTKELATQYLPVIINNLLEVMCTRKGHVPKLESFKSLVQVLHKVSSGDSAANAASRNELLELYSTYIFNQTFDTHKSVYQTLCSNFLLYMMEKKMEGLQMKEDTESVFGNSWFIFDLIIKSMILELNKAEKLTGDRTGVFDDNFTRVLSKLMNAVTKYFGNRLFGENVNAEMGDIRLLNKNLALFIKDLLSIFDRGIVLDMVRQYLTEMKDLLMISKLELTSVLRFEFLRIVCDHEHFIPLNLPFDYGDMSFEALSKKHPLATIIIYEVIETIKSCNLKAAATAIGCLYDIVCKAAFDKRYQDPLRKERIASIFFLLLQLMITQYHSVSPWYAEASVQDRRELLSCVLFILRTCNRTMLRKWWCSETPRCHHIFLQILVNCVKTFEFDPTLTRATKSLLTPQVALFMKQVGTPEMTELLKGLARQLNAEERASLEDKRLRQLSVEAHTLVLDVLEDFMEDFSAQLNDYTEKNTVMEQVVKLLATLLRVKQSEPFTHLIYASLRAFCHRFKDTLFLGENTYIGKIVKRILIHLNFREAPINIEASTLLFVILKLNNRVTGHFGRTRIQTVTSLSNLVASGRIAEDIALSEAFSRLSKYAMYGYSTLAIRDVDPTTRSFKDDEYASTLYSHFARGVQDLAATLSAILNDTIRVNELKKDGDKESIADLFLQIADSYANTPDLRITWLRQLAQFQDKEQNFAEAALCYTSAAALIADYLQNFAGLDYIDRSVFTSVSPDIKEFADDAEDGVSMSSEFTEKSLITNVRMAINFFKQDDYYEAAAQLYKILVPIYEKQHNYHQLSQAFMQLHKCWNEVEFSNEKRLFGKYFRIGFYGEKFDALNQREFVYKEPKLTHLLDISERLKTHFSEYCKMDIDLIDASKFAKTEGDLDPLKCYILITFVEPFIDPEENRETFLEMNTRLTDFVYETPFTMSGKAHAESVSDQYKRKTVLTVGKSFPFMIKRLPVIRKRDIIITPIENAVENIEKRNQQITNEVSRSPINPKTLQQVLQGSVRLQVNEGATSICKIFLADRAFINHPRDHVEALCSAMTSFIQLCKMALAQNAGCAKTDTDRAFHVEMDIGFKQLEAEMTEILNSVVYEDVQSLSESNSEAGGNDSTFGDYDDDETSDSASSPRLSRKGAASPRLRKSDSTRRSESPAKVRKSDSNVEHVLDPEKKRIRTPSGLGSSRSASATPAARKAGGSPKPSAIKPPSGPPPSKKLSSSGKKVPKSVAKNIKPPSTPPPAALAKHIKPPAGPPPSSLVKKAEAPATPPRTPTSSAPASRPSFSSLSSPAAAMPPPPIADGVAALPPPVAADVTAVPPPIAADVSAVPPPIAAVAVPPPIVAAPPPPIDAGDVAAMVPPPIADLPPPPSE